MFAEFQRWRLICLGFGIILLLVAPIVSSWVPFYYSSTMAIGILLVVIILLFQVWRLSVCLVSLLSFWLLPWGSSHWTALLRLDTWTLHLHVCFSFAYFLHMNYREHFNIWRFFMSEGSSPNVVLPDGVISL